MVFQGSTLVSCNHLCFELCTLDDQNFRLITWSNTAIVTLRGIEHNAQVQSTKLAVGIFCSIAKQSCFISYAQRSVEKLVFLVVFVRCSGCSLHQHGSYLVVHLSCKEITC